jgi:hypothetical protein
MSDSRPRGYRSLFWPIILIGVGVVWLLGNLNLLPANSLYWLGNLWPLLLIGIGADLIFARRLPALGAAIGLILIAVVLLVLFLGPNVGLPQPSAPQMRTFTVPLEGNTSATVNLDLTSLSTTIRPLSATSPNLFDAQVYDRGNLKYSNQGSNGNMNIELGESGFSGFWLNLSGDYHWMIGLSPKVPTDLTIHASSGSSNVDLSGLQLTRLEYDGSSGSNELILPSNTRAYDMTYHGSSGSADISVPANANLTMTVTGSSGSISINVQGNPALRVEVNGNGSGSVSVNGGLRRLSGGGNSDQGVWESSGYASADQKILIIVDRVSSGSISIN